MGRGKGQGESERVAGTKPRTAIVTSTHAGTPSTLGLRHAYDQRSDAEQMLLELRERGLELAFELTGDEAEAEDLFQQAAIFTLSNFTAVPPTAWWSWLSTVIRTCYRNEASKSARRRSARMAAVGHRMDDPVESPEEDARREELVRLVKEALQTCSAEERSLIIETIVDQKSVGEIAAAKGVKRSTISMRLARVTDRLKNNPTWKRASEMLGLAIAAMATRRAAAAASVVAVVGAGVMVVMMSGGAKQAESGPMIALTPATSPPPAPPNLSFYTRRVGYAASGIVAWVEDYPSDPMAAAAAGLPVKRRMDLASDGSTVVRATEWIGHKPNLTELVVWDRETDGEVRPAPEWAKKDASIQARTFPAVVDGIATSGAVIVTPSETGFRATVHYLAPSAALIQAGYEPVRARDGSNRSRFADLRGRYFIAEDDPQLGAWFKPNSDR